MIWTCHAACKLKQTHRALNRTRTRNPLRTVSPHTLPCNHGNERTSKVRRLQNRASSENLPVQADRRPELARHWIHKQPSGECKRKTHIQIAQILHGYLPTARMMERPSYSDGKDTFTTGYNTRITGKNTGTTGTSTRARCTLCLDARNSHNIPQSYGNVTIRMYPVCERRS